MQHIQSGCATSLISFESVVNPCIPLESLVIISVYWRNFCIPRHLQKESPFITLCQPFNTDNGKTKIELNCISELFMQVTFYGCLQYSKTSLYQTSRDRR